MATLAHIYNSRNLAEPLNYFSKEENLEIYNSRNLAEPLNPEQQLQDVYLQQ